MPIPESVQELIERYEANRESYRGSAYNEAQVRQEFINPFFAALGWDVDNTQGFAEAYKDVIHEDAIKIGGVTKAPDYSFRIGGTRKFFLEAKKPAVVLKFEKSAAFQLRRYAWSAKLPLSLLTNFAEFAVYDCRIGPEKEDQASKARLFYYTSKDYAEKWDEIEGIFSKNAILKGSFDKFAESSKGKRGTAEVDAAFLAQIEAWRDQLARSLAVKNPDLSQRDLNFAVQRTIDRIVFLRICEDRGMEPYGQLQALLNGANAYPRLCGLFQAADDRYNSGLFHFQADKVRPEEPDGLTLKLGIDDKTLKDILRGLYYPDSPYVFSVIPADILGQAYEQFLGKIIRLTAGHRAIVEDKPEVKKAGGVYYTPTYIVEYIVRHTLGKLLAGKTPKDAAKLRVLDPACGSGSFLIGAFQFLLDWHRDWYVADGPAKHKKELYEGPGGLWLLTSATRKAILRNSIFGVDIDAQAVEVTKLSLLLKVLEGESAETLNSNLKLFKERALPDLGDNIKCGNSLIGPDFYDLPQVATLDTEEMLRINPFDWAAEFKAIMQGGGFDAVIGNPPYVFARDKGFTEYEKLIFLKNFRHQSYQLNTFSIFLEKGFNLLAAKGILGYIIPNNWLTISTMKHLRDFILTSTSDVEIINNLYKVFSGASVDTSIVTFKKNKPNTVSLIEALSPTERKHIANVSPMDLIENQLIQFRAYKDFNAKKIVDLIEKDAVHLQALSLVKSGLKAYETGKGLPIQTDKMKQERVYHRRDKLDSTYRIYLDGKDVKRYSLSWSGQYLKYGKVLAAPRSKELFDGPRILVRQIPSHPPYSINAIIVIEDELNDINSMIVKPISAYAIEFLLGILNSKLLTFWFGNKFDKMQRGIFPQFKVNELAVFPIHTINFDDPADKAKHDHMVGLVEKMLKLHKELSTKIGQEKTLTERQIAATDAQIDRLVFDLYGLTEDEIKIVEAGSG